MKKYFFSIIIPTLNEEFLITRILTQISNQNFKNFQVINVDAKSEDKTREIINNFAKKHKNIEIKTIISEKKNVCYQKNLGAENSFADWLIFMDADNQIEENFLNEIYTKILDQKHVSGFTTFFTPDENKFIYKLVAFFLNWTSLFSLYTKKPFVTESLFIFNREKFLKIKGFDENVKVAEGAELVSRMWNHNLLFSLLKNPKYTNSMRRLEKNGAIKTILSNMKIAYYMFIKGEQTKDKKFSKMYKMEGGKSHLK